MARAQFPPGFSIDEAAYRQLFDTIDRGFCIIEFIDGPDGPNSDYMHVAANAAYALNTGIDNVVGQRVREMVPDEADAWVARYRRVLETGEPMQFERTLEATGRHLELAAFRLEPPERRQVAVMFRDITARANAETALRQLNHNLEGRVADALAERRLLADVVEGTDAFVQVLDRDLRIIAMNVAAKHEFDRAFGVDSKVGDTFPELLADRPEDRDRLIAIWRRALDGEEVLEVADFGVRPDKRRDYELRLRALRDEDGWPIGAYLFGYDVTERLDAERRLREAEDALRQAQKMEAVGQLTGGLAHDFNNLLAAISGAFEMIALRLRQGREGDVQKYLDAGQGATRRAAALTHRLLAFSRRQTLSPRPLVVNRLLPDLVELVRRTVGPEIAVETVAAPDLWPTLVDANQLENALLNLCINARDAMPGGGTITIETANIQVDEDAAHVSSMTAGQYAMICVSDTGIGIDETILDRVFDPFFTTKPIGAGTGLGLSMVYGFARQSHGHVRIYSEIDHGTIVSIYLPRHIGEAPLTVPSLAQATAPAAAEGLSVLVIDDEAPVRMLIADALSDLGYACLEAGDGASGLKLIEAGLKIDLLITDVGLPGGLNGRQVADAARALRPGLKVLFITGYAEQAVLNHGNIGDGMDILTKPFAVADLATRVQQMVHDS